MLILADLLASPIPPLIAVAGLVGLGIVFDIRRLDDPFVAGGIFLAVFWLLGAGLGSAFPAAPKPTATSFLLLLLGFAAYLSGGLVASRWPRADGGALRRYGRVHPVRSLDPSVSQATYALLLIGYVGAALFFWIAGGIPLLAQEAEQHRVDVRSGIGFLIIPTISAITLSTATLASQATLTQTRRLSTALIALTSCAVLLGIGNRGPAILLAIALVWIVLTYRGIPSLRLLGGIAMISIAALGILAVFRSGSTLALDLVVRRAEWQLHVNSTNLAVLESVVPTVMPFQLGFSYLQDLAVLLPGHQPNVGQIVKEASQLDFPGGGLTIGLIGESFLNFGLPGVVLLPFATGVSFARVRSRVAVVDPLDHALAILLALTLMGIMNSGLMSPLLYQTIPLVILVLGLRYFPERARRVSVSAKQSVL